MATTNETNAELLTQLEDEKKTALSDLEKTYGGMVSDTDDYYQAQIDAAQEYADKQTALQNEQTELALSQIEQQKAQAQKDYTKEQSAAYVDWQKESNKYGANAEQMAAAGLAGSGYSESSQVSMYNTYQNRVAAARESYQQAVLNYDNAMAEARLQNSSVLAEIAYQTLQTQLALSLEGFQYKNQLLLDLSDKKLAVESSYLDTLAELTSANNAAINKDEDDTEYEVVTDYWKGDLNPDAEIYGTFSNGYQPKGISGHGTLSKSGDKVTFTTETLAGEEKTVTQEIWVAEDGTYWYWEGRANQYISYTPRTEMDASEEQYLKTYYPDGKVTDKEIWDAMVSKYGEDYLSENGWTYVSPGGGSGVDVGGKSRTQLVHTLQ